MSERDIVCNMVITLSRFKMFRKLTASVIVRTKYELF